VHEAFVPGRLRRQDTAKIEKDRVDISHELPRDGGLEPPHDFRGSFQPALLPGFSSEPQRLHRTGHQDAVDLTRIGSSLPCACFVNGSPLFGRTSYSNLRSLILANALMVGTIRCISLPFSRVN